jgi:Domain of unknown function (DUF4389)
VERAVEEYDRRVDTSAAHAAPEPHPVQLVVTDDLRRSRITSFFRLLLAIPHFIWVVLWGILAVLAILANWVATLVSGRPPASLHNFLARFLRYMTHVFAYAFLIADPFPSFAGRPGYPIDLEVGPPENQSRLTVFFRFFLALPALLVAQILRYLSQLLAFFSWITAVVLGRVPRGIRDFAAFALRFEQQTNAYLYLLTGRYPGFDIRI